MIQFGPVRKQLCFTFTFLFLFFLKHLLCRISLYFVFFRLTLRPLAVIWEHYFIMEERMDMDMGFPLSLSLSLASIFRLCCFSLPWATFLQVAHGKEVFYMFLISSLFFFHTPFSHVYLILWTKERPANERPSLCMRIARVGIFIICWNGFKGQGRVDGVSGCKVLGIDGTD